MAHANVEIGGTAGVHVFSKTNELGVNDVAGANSEHNAAMFGVRLGVFFGSFIGVEGEFGVIPSESRKMTFDVWNITYRGNLVAQLRANNPDNKIIPFVLVGGGAFQIVDNGGAKNNAQIRKDTDATLYVGLGAKYRVDNGWGLRADLRLLFPPSSKDDSFTEDFEALLSIYKEFGRGKPVPAKVVDNDPDHDGISKLCNHAPAVHRSGHVRGRRHSPRRGDPLPCGAHGQQVRALPQRPAVPLALRGAEHGHPGRGLQPPRLGAAGGELRHPVPPRAGDRRDEAAG